MLVLERAKNEAVLVPSVSMKIVVISIDNGKVRLGFEAPREVDIVRDDAKNPNPKDRTNGGEQR
jgi:carbon storage regulator CsrA